MGTVLILILSTLVISVTIVHHLARIAPLEPNDVTIDLD